MKKLTALLLAGAMMLSLAACGGGSSSNGGNSGNAGGNTGTGGTSAAGTYDALPDTTLILADSAAEGAAGQIFDKAIGAKLEEITGGKFTLQVEVGGTLGNDTDLIRQMDTGDIAMVGCQVAPMVSFVQDLAVFDLPMVFAKYDGDTIHKTLNDPESPVRQALDKAYEDYGWHLLGFLQNATYRLTTSNKDVSTLDGFKGLLIRTMENNNHMAFWKAIDASPTPMAWGEVYFACSSGNIEAEENAADTIAGAGLNEVQKYLACTNHILYVNQVCISKSVWDGLDPLYQEALQQAVNEAIDEVRPQLIDIDKNYKQQLTEGGMTLIEYDEDFFNQVLADPEVVALYESIDKDQINGLGTTLQETLEKYAG